MDVSTSSVKPPRGVRHGERRLRSFMASTRRTSELTPTLRSPLESALLGRPHLRRARPADPPPPRPSPQPQPQPALLAANRSAPTRRRNRLARPTATRRHCRRHAPRTGQGPIHPRIPPHHRRTHHRGARNRPRPPRRPRGGVASGQRWRRLLPHRPAPIHRGDPYIDIGCCPYELPLGALIPVRLDNLLPGARNIGTTHITNGAYRMPLVEWNTGEVTGHLVAYCTANQIPPRAVRSSDTRLADFQRELDRAGIERRWPRIEGY